jgi:hypothetical protein
MTEKMFMKPGKDNKEDRINFVKFWVEYIKSHSDEEWSRQQNKLINSQLKSARELKLVKPDKKG